MASVLKVDEMQGVTSAGDITITGEGGTGTQSLQQGLCKAWVNCDGTDSSAAVRDSFNISSTTDNAATGQVDLAFTNNFNNNDYSPCGWAASIGNSTAWVGGPPSIVDSEMATGTLNIFTSYQNSLGAEYVYTCANVFGDLA